MSETNWIVQRDENRYSASDVAVLQQWATSGTIRPADQIWSPVRNAWAVATDTPEVANLLAPAGGEAIVNRTPAFAVRPAPGIDRASVGLRGAAYLIDILPAFLIALIALIPLVGHIVAGLLIGFYWLYRDAAKFSLGKMALGLQVVQMNGEPATPHALKRRNLPLAIGAFVGAIPLAGMILGPITGLIAFIVTVLLLLTEGYTLGDKWAGTTVVKRS
jgi:uncharacterized RDD family membrane protein YckC